MANPGDWQRRADLRLRACLQRFEHGRDALVKQAHQALSADPRLVAAWLFGSLGRGDADELSDIDLFVVTADGHHERIVSNRPAFMAQLGEPLLILEAPQNWPPGGVYNMALYPGEEGPHQVDWYWVRHSAAALPTETRLLFDHAGLPRLSTPTRFTYQPVPPRPPEEVATQDANLFWVMLLISAKYIARSPWEQVLAPPVDLLQKVAAFARVPLPNGIDQAPTPAAPLARIDHLRRLAAAMETLAPPVAARGGRPPTTIAPYVTRYLGFVEALIRASARHREFR
jgi:predicted nucleotidyltransferase